MDVRKSVQKKRKAKHFHETSRPSKALCFTCNTWRAISHNKGVTKNKGNGVWKQEIADICGKRRIYTAFLVGKLITRFKACAE